MSKSITRRDAFAGTAAVALGVAAVAAGAGVAEAAQPNMEAALANLQAARNALQNATANKGGHRQNAIRLIDQAIAEVKAGIRYAN